MFCIGCEGYETRIKKDINERPVNWGNVFTRIARWMNHTESPECKSQKETP